MTIKKTLGSLTIQTPDLSDIPVPRTAGLIARGIEVVDGQRAAMRERGQLEDALLAAENGERQSMGDAYGAGNFEDPEDMGEAVADLRKQIARIQARIDAFEAAKVPLPMQIREAVAAESPAWAEHARRNAGKALAKLTTAARQAEDARNELASSIGVLGTLRGFASEVEAGGLGQLRQHVKPNGYTFSLEAGIPALREAVALATEELAELS
jgi:hypothetical protein